MTLLKTNTPDRKLSGTVKIEFHWLRQEAVVAPGDEV